MQAGSMKSKDFAEQWCKLMGEDAGKQLDMFGLGMYVDYAMPMCKCVTATVKDIGKTPRIPRLGNISKSSLRRILAV